MFSSVLASGCGEDTGEMPEYGSVRIELQNDDKNGIDPFEDTSSIILKVFYLDCLRRFYAIDHPELSLEDAQGRAVFTEWESRVCAAHDPTDPVQEMAYIGCSFEPETWQQEVLEASTEWYLKSRYKVSNDDMSGRHIRIGPVPTDMLTEGCTPLMKVQNTSVVGVDDRDKTMWHIASSQREVQGPASAQAMRIDIIPKMISDPGGDDEG